MPTNDKALENAVIALEDNPYFILFLAEIERLRNDYYERHVLSLDHDAPPTLIARNMGVLLGLEQAFKAPSNILAAAKKQRQKPQEYDISLRPEIDPTS